MGRVGPSITATDRYSWLLCNNHPGLLRRPGTAYDGKVGAAMTTDQDRTAEVPGVPARDRYSVRRLSVPGGSLAVGVWEAVQEPSRPTVVAIHGITGNHRCWPYLVEKLPASRVVAPDLRGRGGSAGVVGPFGMARHADDVVAILDALDVASAVIVGHSMGGYVALVTADRHEDRVRSLVLVDGGLPLGGHSTEERLAEVERVTSGLANRLAMTFPSVESGVQFWRHHPAFEASWTPLAEDYARYDLGGRPPRLRSRVTAGSVMADSKDVVDGDALAGALKRLRHPTQWLIAPRGLLDDVPPLYPPPAVVHWHEMYPQIEIRPVNDVNHYTIVMGEEGGQAIGSAVTRAR